MITAIIAPVPKSLLRYAIKNMIENGEKLKGIHMARDIFAVGALYTGGYISQDMKDIIVLLNNTKYGHILVCDYFKKFRNVNDIERGRIKFDWAANDTLNEIILADRAVSRSEFMNFISVNVADEYIGKLGNLEKVADKKLYEENIKKMLFEMYKKLGARKLNMKKVAIWNGIKIIGQETDLDNVTPDQKVKK